MAITHSIKFTASAKTAISEIEKYEDKIVATAQTVDKYASALGGSKILAQANNWVAAVDKIGGATKLTGAEQEKVNRILDQAIAKYTALGKAAPTAMTELYDATKPVPKTLDAIAVSATKADSALSSIGKSAAGYLAGMATFATAQRVVGGAVDFMQESVKEAAKAEAAQTRLATAMRQNGIATDANRQAFAALADELQRTTVYEDDQIVALEAMATQLGVLPSQMDGAVKAAANLASGLGIDLEKAMTMIVRANNESYTAFNRLGVSIDEARAKTEGLPYILAQLNAGMGGQAAAEVETYAGQVAQLANEWGNLKEALGGALIGLGQTSGLLGSVTDALRGMNALLSESTLLWYGLTRGVGMNLQGVLELALKLGKAPAPKLDPKGVSDGAMAMRQALDGVNASLDKLLVKAKDQTAKGFEEAAKTAAKAAEGVRQFEASLRAMHALPTWQKVNDAIRATPPLLEDVAQAVDGVPPALQRMNNATEDVLAQMARLNSVPDWQKIAESIKATPPLLEEVAQAAEGVPAMLKRASADTDKSAKAWATLGHVFGEVSRAAEMAGHKTTAAVMSIGSAIAAAAPGGLWAMVGAGAMATFSVLSDKIFKTEGRKVNDLRDAYISAAGGLGELNRKAVAAGVTLDKLLKAQTVKDYEAAVASLNAKLEKTAQIQGELAGLQAQLADRQVMDWKKAEETIAKYGGSVATLGQQFVQAKSSASWGEILDDFELLRDMGGDIGGVLSTMADEMSVLVQESLRAGTEIPENMRPYLEELARSGQLLDENGEKMTDLGKLKWGAPLVSEVDRIVAAIDKLVDALTGHLIPALGAVPREVPVHIRYTSDEYPDPSGIRAEVPVPGYARGTGGFIDFGRGTLAMLHGREAVVPAGGSASTAPIVINLVAQLDGKAVARNQVRYLPSELALAGR